MGHLEKSFSIEAPSPPSNLTQRCPGLVASSLPGAKVNRDGLVTLLRECKGLVMLDVRDCSGFDENNDEISKLASHIRNVG
ncbi:unnamed protein product [Prunus armeniaca]